MSPVHPHVGSRMTDATHHGKRREAHAGVSVTSDAGAGNRAVWRAQECRELPDAQRSPVSPLAARVVE